MKVKVKSDYDTETIKFTIENIQSQNAIVLEVSFICHYLYINVFSMMILFKIINI